MATITSYAEENQLVPSRTCAIVYHELAGPAADVIDFETIDAQIERLGFQVLRGDEEENAEFRIRIVVRYYPAANGTDAFSSFEYDIFYRDTLYSVSPSLNIGGVLDAERVKLGFEFLNRNLAFLIDRYPIPEPASGEEVKMAEPDARPNAGNAPRNP